MGTARKTENAVSRQALFFTTCPISTWIQLIFPALLSDDKSSDPDKSPKPDKEWPLPNKPVNVFGNAAGASSSGRGSSLLKAPDPRDGRSGDAATPPQDRSATFPGARGPNDKKPRVLRPKKSFKDLQKLVTKSSDALHAMFKKK
jgi:hypothetical protein